MRKSNGSRPSVFNILAALAMFSSAATVVGLGVLAFAGSRTILQEPKVQESNAPDGIAHSETEEQAALIASLKLTTAEQVLKALKSPDTLIITELSEPETQKVAKVLREQYPLESLRKRMGKMPIAPSKKAKDAESPVRFGWNNRRAAALESLHSNEVSKFINTDGFGVFRVPTPSMSDLKFADEYATKIDRSKVGSAYLEGKTIELQKTGKAGWTKSNLALSPNGLPTNEYMALLSAFTSETFASRNSTGFVQDIDHVAGFYEHRIRMRKDWDGSINQEKFFNQLEANLPKWKGTDWKMNRVELVSLLMNEEPKVYVSENLPNMEELSSETAEKRKLDAFELESLEKLKAGEQIVTQSTLNRIVMLGAIRANAGCIECHDVKEQELLGAFSYEILRHPPVLPAANAKPF